MISTIFHTLSKLWLVLRVFDLFMENIKYVYRTMCVGISIYSRYIKFVNEKKVWVLERGTFVDVFV